MHVYMCSGRIGDSATFSVLGICLGFRFSNLNPGQVSSCELVRLHSLSCCWPVIASGHGLSDPGNRRLVGVFCLVPRVYGLISVISIWRQARGFCFERWGNPRHLFERVSLKDLLCYSLLRILFGHGRSLHCCIDHSDRCPRSVLRPSKLTVAAIRVLSHWVQQIRHL